MRTTKLISISQGKHYGEVVAKVNIAKESVTFCANINGKTVAEGPVFHDLRELIVTTLGPTQAEH